MSKTNGTIVTAWAESAAGPGWSNSPVWYLVRDQDQQLHLECLQPDQQTPDLRLLYAISQATHLRMTGAVQDALAWGKK